MAETLEELGSEARIQCLIESALGLERAFEIATSHERVAGISLGEADLSADLGVGDETGLLYARSRIVSAARAAALPRRSRACTRSSTISMDCAVLPKQEKLGFVGRSTIHPSQVPVVNDVFTPTEEEVSEAEGLLGRLGNEEGAFVLEDGRFVDRAVVESRASRSLWREGGSALRTVCSKRSRAASKSMTWRSRSPPRHHIRPTIHLSGWPSCGATATWSALTAAPPRAS